MTDLQLAILGLGLGGAYALLSLGVVTIYRGTGVPNFAQGAIAMASAYAFYELRDNLGVPSWIAAVAAGVFAIGIGCAFHFLVMKQLRHAPVLARILATVALILLLRGLAVTFLDVSTRTPTSSLPTGIIGIGSMSLSEDRLYLAGIAIVIAIVLAGLSRYTRIGLAVRALADSEKGAQLTGFSPNVLSAVTWATGSILAAAAGILISPIAGLDADSLTLLIVPVFCVALVARFSSYLWAVVAALLVGAAQSILQQYSQPGAWWTWLWEGPGRAGAFPAFLIIIVMIVSGRVIPSRGELRVGRLPISPQPRHLVLAPIAVLVVAVVFFEIVNGSWIYAGTTSAIGGILALSLVVLTGFVGQISLAQVALAGVGGLAAARIVGAWHLPFLVVLLCAGVIAAVVGFAIGLPALRVRGPSLAIVTLAAAFIIQSVIFQDNRILGHSAYLKLPIPSVFGYQMDNRAFGVFATAVAVILGLAVSGLRMSRFGRRGLAVRENERAAAAAGVSLRAYKLLSFSVAAGIAGVAGALMGYQQGVFSADGFTIFASLTVLVVAYIGGIGMVGGSVLAGFGAAGGLFSQLLNVLHAESYLEIIAGLGLMIAIQLHPDGLASLLAGLRERRARRQRAVEDQSVSSELEPRVTTARTVQNQDLAVRSIEMTPSTHPE